MPYNARPAFSFAGMAAQDAPGDPVAATHALRDQERASVRAQSYFIAWDGEGARDDQSEAQQYVLFGCSTGDVITGPSLSTEQCIALMFDVKASHPHAIHVGFAFDYDVNMILKDLSPHHFFLLHKNNRMTWREYRFEHVPHKWFMISRVVDGKRETIKINDVFGFFQCSFVKACKSYIADHELMARFDIIEAGKKARNSFTYAKIKMISEYWQVEIQLLEALVTELRTLMHQAGFMINSWHGPGALANYVYRRHGIKAHKQDGPTAVLDAAQYAYAGGRFELFRMGRHVGPVYSLDINSAYPAGIARLPSLTEGVWKLNPFVMLDDLQEFALYHVELREMFIKQPGPLFHRSEAGNVTFPPRTTGWYWTPEVKAMLAHVDHRSITITEGWEYIGWQSRPFSEFVPEYFDRRRAWKSAGVGAEKAIKLALNSLYGKMAQRVGWERTGGAPTWHQLEWAGWVTSFTRAALYDVLARIPWQDQIAVETDGIYTTATPESLGIDHSKALGEWEIKEYDELLYLQSGVYCLRAGGEWTSKYRGLNPGALSAQDMAEYLQTCKPGEPWEPITGPDTKFIGYQTALARSRKNHERFHDQHRHWVTIPDRKIDVGSVGKRVHRNCRTCKDQLTAYEYPHDLTIASAAFKDWQSTRHHIPWRDDDQEPEWRQAADDQRGLLR